MRTLFITCLLTLCVFVDLPQVKASEPFQDASWIRGPVFKSQELLGVFDSQKSKTKGTKLRNIHTYFRKEIDLPEMPVKAVLYVTGDDYYKLFVNGQFLVQGPEPGYPFAHPYYELKLSNEEIAKRFRKGKNCLAAHAYYHGVATRAFNSADNRSGLALRLELTFPDGSTKSITTNDTWKCFHEKAFSSSRMFGYETQFNENIDMRIIPTGWRQVGFDDSSWQTPLVQQQDHCFTQQITPPLEHWRADPVVIKKKGKENYFFDFGGELTGHTRIRIQGQEGDVITVRHGEELLAKDTVRHKMRCNCNYEDQITLSGRDDLIEFYDYRAFRYIEILNAPSKPEIWVDVRHHPFDAEASHFHSSDEMLNKIWDMCKRGVQMGCQGIIVDCPSREKGQYGGDTYMTILSQLILTADPTLPKKAIKDFQLSQRFCDGMLAVAPGGFQQHLAEWSLIWPATLRYYYQMTGDKDFVCEMVETGALDKLLGYFAKLETESGLLTGVDKKKWVLIDWPGNLRGGYDYEKTKNDENAVVNAFYYRALRDSAALMQVAGEEEKAKAYDAKADRLKTAFAGRLLDPKTRLFRDGANSQHLSLHASAFPLDFGLVSKENESSVIDMIRHKRMDCGLYAATYVAEGCYKAGQGELAYDLMTSKDKHSWSEMIRSGATTPMEAWAPDLKWNTSFCHPACGTPIYLITTHMMGLQPIEPGWKAIRVAPQIPKSLENVELKFPIPAGSVMVKYTKADGYHVTVPKGTEVIVQAPKEISVKIHYADPRVRHFH